jgi:hypothetical protein
MRIRAIAWSLACLGIACSSSHSAPLWQQVAGGAGSGSKGAGSGSGSSSSADRSDGHGGVLPAFPGAGTSDAGDPLPNGMLCDAVAGAKSPLPKAVRQCFYSATDLQHPAATLEQVLECSEGKDSIHLRLTFDPSFVDNTYGENAIGWGSRAMAAPAMMMMGGMAKPMKMGKSGHTFMDLVGSDHAEIQVTDDSGKVVLQFKLDYISVDPSRPSGYGCLGVTGGEGKVIVGNADWVVGYTTSLDRDLNERGYASYTTDSPATDENYTPNKDTPEWDYRVVYEAWISLDALGSAGFGGANIEFVHASPSKASSNTVDVKPNDCPPDDCGDDHPDTVCNPPPPDDCSDGDPDTVCNDNPPPPPPPDGCVDHDPDTPCTDGGTVPPPPGTGGNGGTPTNCTDPDDPACHVD